MTAELEFELNGHRYIISYTDPFSRYDVIMLEEDKKAIIEKELVRRVARTIMDKCHIRWNDS